MNFFKSNRKLVAATSFLVYHRTENNGMEELMSLGTNLQYLRKKKGMTQEALAETLDVSRQTVSKWESDGAFPETDKIIALCDLFSCNMDELVRGDMQRECAEADLEYDKHMNHFSLAISLGVALVLLGVTLMILLEAFCISDSICLMVFLFLVAVAAAIFVASGIGHGNFVKNNPTVGRIYDEKTIRAYDRKFIYFIAVPVAFIIIGVIWIVGADAIPVPAGFEQERWEMLITAPFMFIVTCAASFLVWAGMQKAKYNVDEYNRGTSASRGGEESVSGRICGCIMLVATAAYLVIGFVWNLWHPGWVVFPVGGILCGIVSTIFPDKEK